MTNLETLASSPVFAAVVLLPEFVLEELLVEFLLVLPDDFVVGVGVGVAVGFVVVVGFGVVVRVGVAVGVGVVVVEPGLLSEPPTSTLLPAILNGLKEAVSKLIYSPSSFNSINS